MTRMDAIAATAEFQAHLRRGIEQNALSAVNVDCVTAVMLKI